MSNIVRIRDLTRETSLSFNTYIPVDKDSYTSNSKKITLSDIAAYVIYDTDPISGFTFDTLTGELTLETIYGDYITNLSGDTTQDYYLDDRYTKQDLSGVVEQLNFQLNLQTGKTFILSEYNWYGYTVDSLAARVNTGSTNLRFVIDSTDINGLSGITITSSQSINTATSNNSALTGSTLKMYVDSLSDIPIIYMSLKITRI